MTDADEPTGNDPTSSGARDDPAPNPHDRIFKVVFGAPRSAAVILREALPRPLREVLDWSGLVSKPSVVVGSGLREGSRDLLFRTTLRAPRGRGEPDSPPLDVTVDLNFEHTSSPRPRLRLQLNGYMQRGWEAADRDPETTGPLTLPVILPVVLNQGPTRWALPQLVELYRLPPGLAALIAPYTPAFEVGLLDLARWTDRRLLRLPRGIERLTLVVMKSAGLDVDMIDLLASWLDDLKAAHAAGHVRTATEVIGYTARVRGEVPDARYFEKVSRILDPAGQESLMNGYHLLSDQFRAEGEAKGRVEEARRLLARQLRRRFPDVVASLLGRLEAASLEELERWADQILVAPTAAEVFSGPGS